VSVPTTSVRPVRARWGLRMTPFRIILLAVAGLTVGIVAYRLIVGLGAPTNLTDRWPWALWTWWKLTGVALAGAGYSTAVVVHFLGRNRWRDVERGAFLTSLLGYLMVCAALILDLGQWYNAWRPLVHWGYHSVMFELYWCIGGYTVVQLVEFLYIFEERVRVPASMRRVLERIYAPLMIVGAMLPIFHQSALCSLYVLAKGRLDPLWWSQLLPLFAILTSFYVGPSVVAVENHVSARSYPRRVDMGVLGEMVLMSAVVMALYLGLRIGDYVVRGVLPELFGTALGMVALAELVLGVAVPMVLFMVPRARASRPWLLTAAALTIGGVALNRFNIVLVGMTASTGEGFYVPYWMEAVFVLGLAAAVILAYLFVVENFAVLPLEERASPAAQDSAARDPTRVIVPRATSSTCPEGDRG
jgi:Ni/Fe-hydrogenase subunit HybB-like protein